MMLLKKNTTFSGDRKRYEKFKWKITVSSSIKLVRVTSRRYIEKRMLTITKRISQKRTVVDNWSLIQ
ncbi:hypothetical protein B9Z55_025261 [Caenorhabditis nigoni]|uniref:Uncharacterized protein n=1 Tax=Caenorhabditis nigoni TaxID=1611254 RepID=A0A2G5SYH3_9PELO|nr:hypothetical protein B9Z55_025261 [Caenorhabditis nigoni]